MAFGKPVVLLLGASLLNRKGKGQLGEWFYIFPYISIILNKCNERPSPPAKEKKIKVAVIIFLHKGVVSVSSI